MNAMTAAAAQTPDPRPQPLQAVREAVKGVLTQSQAFAQLPPAQQQQVAGDTALIADYLVRPEGIPGNNIPGGVGMPQALAGVADSGVNASSDKGWEAVDDIGKNRFSAAAGREGAEVAGLLLQKVNFVQLRRRADPRRLQRHRGFDDQADGGLFADGRAGGEVARTLSRGQRQPQPGPRPYGRQVSRHVRDRHGRLFR